MFSTCVCTYFLWASSFSDTNFPRTRKMSFCFIVCGWYLPCCDQSLVREVFTSLYKMFPKPEVCIPHASLRSCNYLLLFRVSFTGTSYVCSLSLSADKGSIALLDCKLQKSEDVPLWNLIQLPELCLGITFLEALSYFIYYSVCIYALYLYMRKHICHGKHMGDNSLLLLWNPGIKFSSFIHKAITPAQHWGF